METPTTQPDIQQLKLLIVDDDDFAIDLFLGAIEGLGVTNCKTAQSGLDALEVVKNALVTNDLDLIICDIEMPDMDGLELLRRLAEVGYSGKVAVISGLDSDILRMAKDLGEAHRLDIVGAVQKPVNRVALSALLYEVANASAKKTYARVKRDVLPEDIQAALDQDELSLFYQPKILVKEEAIYGAEALIRWFSSKFGGIVGPDEFIPVAESSGLINDLTQRVIEKALKDMKVWKEAGLKLRISVNVSMHNLAQLNFASDLASTLREHLVEPEDIMLEITESSLMDDATSILEVLARLKMLKIGLSIDDFGTGYSSMGQLQKIPFVELKIDRSFVYGAGESASTLSILESSASLAKQLKISSVAEGVETREDWDRVAKLGIDLVQGYFISKPMPANEFTAWVDEWKAVPTS